MTLAPEIIVRILDYFGVFTAAVAGTVNAPAVMTSTEAPAAICRAGTVLIATTSFSCVNMV